MPWTDWEPMPEMRFVRPPITSVAPSRLQQKWVRLQLDDSGHKVLERDYEWRDVPTVLIPEPQRPEPSRRTDWHYDSQGYCDNPGRGTGANRYWEGRWRDAEAALNHVLQRCNDNGGEINAELVAELKAAVEQSGGG